ncbi:blue copper protein 1a-like [Syzygium oleosum]|uniref:blue copper protein 1a-like n=1 Tax=Syzygium oleosum TaxID=219896 RepID=UPI0024BBA476|nr:blue copper protein 1a-like [Syzygium oleosum]
MASQFAILAIVALVALPSVALATQWNVGDGSGWTINYNYTDWAKDKVFHVGDSLLFSYQAGNHNVLKISNATDFQACNKPPANEVLTSGHDVIPLNTTGVKWYICGIGEHCTKLNQKLKITVVDGNSTASDKKSGANALVSSSFKILAAAVVALVLVTA